jgi:hypothetical protein
MINSKTVTTESWFLPFDSIMIITTSLSIILGLIFLFIVITHRRCWSISMLLICNSCLVEVLLGCVLLSMAIFTFQNDLKQETGNISSCVLISFLCYVTDAMQNYSYLLTAMYRYMSVVYPARLLWQSAKFQIALIIGQWIFSIVYAVPLLITEQIVYNVDNQICQVPLRLSVTMIYLSIILYTVPNLSIVCLYIKLVRYVRQISNRTTLPNTLFHARRELRLIQRTLILSNVLIILGFPYTIFVITSFITTPPKYHFRIAYIFIDISILSIMVMIYYFTQQIIEIIQKIFSRPNAVVPMQDTARTRY